MLGYPGPLPAEIRPLPDFRTGVMRAVQQTIERRIEAVELMAAFVIEHTGLQSRHGIEQGLSLSARYRPELVVQARSAGGLSKEDEAFLSRQPANGASENSKKL